MFSKILSTKYTGIFCHKKSRHNMLIPCRNYCLHSYLSTKPTLRYALEIVFWDIFSAVSAPFV